MRADPFPALFAATLALYVMVIVGRIHEAIPFVAKLYLGKTTALVLIAAACLQLRGQDFSRFSKTTLARAIAVITGIGILSIPVSFWPSQSLAFFETQWPQTMLLFVCVTVGFMNRKTALWCIIGLVAATTIGVVQILRGGGPDIGGRLFIGNGLSQTYDPNESAALFVMVLPYVALLAARKGKLRFLMIPLVPAYIAALLRTNSRGGMVALAILALSFLVIATKKQRKAFLVLFPLIAATLVMLPHADILARFSELVGGTDYNIASPGGRWPIWKNGLALMFTHPLLGIGVGAYETANAVVYGSWKTAHNAYIEIGVELGVGGLIAFLLAIRTSLMSGWRLRAASQAPANDPHGSVALDRLLVTAALCSLIAELSAAIFLSMAYDPMTMFALAVPVGLAMGTVARAVPAQVTANARQSGPATGWRTGRRPVGQPIPPARARA
jgi:O-antigen ligase